jgi:acetyl-CoA carboxylase biotin carboxyl carrier protein
MAIEIAQRLIEALKDSDVTEMTLEKGEFKLVFRKDEAHIAQAQHTAAAPAIPPAGDKKPGLPEKKLIEIKSTMVGTFHVSTSPDRPPLVIEGDHVMPGQKVGVIEAVKVMKDVISAVQGKVMKVLVPNDHPVEYGQPLFLIDPFDNNTKTGA